MNTNCPNCNGPYNINESHIGRKFKCKKCGSALVVTDLGIELQHADPVSQPAAPASAFDFDAGGPAEQTVASAPSKPAKTSKKRVELEEEGTEAEDDLPSRPARKPRAGGGGLVEFLTFRKMVVPIIIQIIFWLLVGAAILSGLVGVASVAAVGGGSGGAMITVMALVAMLIIVPIYILLIRIGCEVLIVIFRMQDTLNDIKQILGEQYGGDQPADGGSKGPVH